MPHPRLQGSPQRQPWARPAEPGPISQYAPSSWPAAHAARRPDVRDRRQADCRSQTASSLNAPWAGHNNTSKGRSGLAVACLTAVREVLGSNCAVGSCVYRKNRCDLRPWARAVCTFPAVPRSTQPSTLRGTVNEYQLSGRIIRIMD